MKADEQNADSFHESAAVPAGAKPLDMAWESFVDEGFSHDAAPPEMMDSLWARGWRHFGPRFYRYSLYDLGGVLHRVQPLRVVLERFAASRSQQRILRRNAEVEVRFQAPRLDAEREALFARHSRRFRENVPQSLDRFLGSAPGVVPCEMVEVGAYLDGRLVAASYPDIGREGASTIYGIFDPACARRSLGIATMLWEIGYARQRGCRYYYPGYAYHDPSPMDYKKQFAGSEWFDWQGRWLPLARATA